MHCDKREIHIQDQLDDQVKTGNLGKPRHKLAYAIQTGIKETCCKHNNSLHVPHKRNFWTS